MYVNDTQQPTRTCSRFKDENRVYDSRNNAFFLPRLMVLSHIAPVIWSMCTLMQFNKDQMLKADRFMCVIRILENGKWKWTGIIQARLNNADSQTQGGKV